MFCPKCSQQQISHDTQFCSRCGFQLNVVKALLVDESSAADERFQRLNLSFKMRDVTIGAAFMFILPLIVAIFTNDLPPYYPARLSLLVIAWIVLTLLLNIKPLFQYFLKGEVTPERLPTPKKLSGIPASFIQATLPSSQSIPADVYFPPAANTADMTKPASVTEQTTNLLNTK